VHPTKAFAAVPWTPVVHTPRSADMMPLDYGIFGIVRARLQDEISSYATWEKKVELFKKILSEAPIEATIKHYELRMKACIETQGKHFEDRLKAMNYRFPAVS